MIVRAINIFCWLNVGKNIYRFRPIRTILWLVPTFVSHLATSGFKDHYNGFVTKIELREDGKHSDVTYLSGKVETVKTTDFQPSNQKDLVGNLQRMGLLGTELFPLKIGQRTLMIDKRGRIEQHEVFKAVCNGYVIDLSVM